MRLKIIKFIAIFFIWAIPITLMALMQLDSSSNSKVPIFITMGILAATAAVWKYKPDIKKETSADKQELDKRS